VVLAVVQSKKALREAKSHQPEPPLLHNGNPTRRIKSRKRASSPKLFDDAPLMTEKDVRKLGGLWTSP
jgi:hypothetical protein